MHQLLIRQIHNHLGGVDNLSGGILDFVKAVNETYAQLSTAPTDTPVAPVNSFQSLIEQLPAIVYVCELGASRRFLYTSSQMQQLLGYDSRDWTNDTAFWVSRIHPEDREAAMRATAQSRKTGEALRAEYRMIARNGTAVWLRDEATVIKGEDGQQLLQGLLYDITATKANEEKLLQDAMHDALTALPNRALLLDRINRAIAIRRRDAHKLYAILCMDLDRFKTINDSIGHAIGDQLLIEFANRLRQILRPGDTVARLGGDEFAVLVEDVKSVEQVIAISDRIHLMLHTPFFLQGVEIFTTSSIGVAMGSDRYSRAQDIMRDAETAMYRAKDNGKASTQMFDQAMHSRVVKQLEIENDLRRAVEREEFVTVFQPIVALDSGTIESAEALVRWKHPEKGFISPADFIPAAEETGLIASIDMQVMRQALTQTLHWQQTLGVKDFCISVNLSARQFRQKDLIERVLGKCERIGIDPRYLKLEITESAIIEDPDAAAKLLEEFRSHHVKVSLDDFGTGYSSLSQLYRFPIDIVKIDRSFVSKLGNGGSSEIVRTIIQLCHSLKMRVTAEGIETESQLEILRHLGCEFGQGYFFAKPLDAEVFSSLLSARKTWTPLRAAG
jgi:diguanylate cyclase (GGDEF)-like protein/PAS domain S-box-containing protein